MCPEDSDEDAGRPQEEFYIAAVVTWLVQLRGVKYEKA